MYFQHGSCFEGGGVCLFRGVFLVLFLNTIWFVHGSLYQQPQNLKSIPDAATVSPKNVKNMASLQSTHYVTFKKCIWLKNMPFKESQMEH